MKRYLVFAMTLVLAPMAMAAEDGENPMVGKPFKFSIEDLNGKTVSNTSETLTGKVVLVDIFGTWCGPCQQAMPHVEALYEEFREDGFEVVGVAFEHGTREEMTNHLKDFVKERDIEYAIVLGGETDEARGGEVLPDLKDFGGYPTFVLLDQDGIVREVFLGFVSDETIANQNPGVASPARLEAAMKALLEGVKETG